MIDAHDHEIALAVRRQINRNVLFMADVSDLTGSIAQARDGFDDRHGILLIKQAQISAKF
jgi:hypothetical protein